MRIAVTCENDQVFQHFGHTPGFAVFEVSGLTIVKESRLSSGESGHGALAALLAGEKVDLLICGGIGGGAVNALANAGIEVVGGAQGNVRDVVEAMLQGNLQLRSDFRCQGHDHGEGHDCGSHSCGNHSCGNH